MAVACHIMSCGLTATPTEATIIATPTEISVTIGGPEPILDIVFYPLVNLTEFGSLCRVAIPGVLAPEEYMKAVCREDKTLLLCWPNRRFDIVLRPQTNIMYPGSHASRAALCIAVCKLRSFNRLTGEPAVCRVGILLSATALTKSGRIRAALHTELVAYVRAKRMSLDSWASIEYQPWSIGTPEAAFFHATQFGLVCNIGGVLPEFPSIVSVTDEPPAKRQKPSA